MLKYLITSSKAPFRSRKAVLAPWGIAMSLVITLPCVIQYSKE